MLSIIIAESALELVPTRLAGHPAVRNDASRREAAPGDILLDRSLHHHAMLRLDEAEKRGRPDLVHLTLLSITSSPLYLAGRVKVYIHTRDDIVLELKEGTRPPKSYARFRDLVQKLLKDRPDEGLIRVYESTIRGLVARIKPDDVVGLSTQGRMSSLEEVAERLVESANPVVLMGGFPKGHFTPETVASLNAMMRVHDDPLDAHVVAARLVYEVESRLSRIHTSRQGQDGPRRKG